MDVGQRSKVAVVVAAMVTPGVRGKSKKTKRHEKRRWTHRDQQQDGGRGVTGKC